MWTHSDRATSMVAASGRFPPPPRSRLAATDSHPRLRRKTGRRSYRTASPAAKRRPIPRMSEPARIGFPTGRRRGSVPDSREVATTRGSHGRLTTGTSPAFARFSWRLTLVPGETPLLARFGGRRGVHAWATKEVLRLGNDAGLETPFPRQESHHEVVVPRRRRC